MTGNQQHPSRQARRALQGFTEWRRRRRKRRDLIPAQLWGAAEELAKAEGACRTARLLRLNYNDLKSRINNAKAGKTAVAPKDLFAEYRLSGDGTGLTCRIDVEGRGTGMMGLDFAGQSPAVVARFVRCLAGWA